MQGFLYHSERKTPAFMHGDISESLWGEMGVSKRRKTPACMGIEAAHHKVPLCYMRDFV